MSRRVIIAGGGTGGHIMPAIYVAKQLQTWGHEVLFITDDSEMSIELLNRADIPFRVLKSGKLVRSLQPAHLMQSARGVMQTLSATVAVHKIFRQFQADAVFCKGGFVSLPVGLVAKKRKVKIVLHESDSVVGLANRILYSSAHQLCTGFPANIYCNKYKQKIVYTGVPIDSRFQPSPLPKEAHVLITGGSLGALSINNHVLRLMALLDKKIKITWICGKVHYERIIAQVSSLPARPNLKILAFTHNMPDLLAGASLVVSRAGATALSEIAASGRPAIIIPFADAAGDHQRKNAQFLSKKEAIIAFEQSDDTESLAEIIHNLSRSQSLALARAIEKFYIKDSAKIIARLIIND